MKACIVKPHNGGLFSLINNVVTCLSLYDYVHVDWSEGCLYGNAWSALFVPNAHPSELSHVDSIDVVSNYPHQILTYKNAGLLYLADDLLQWRRSCHRHWSKLQIQPGLLKPMRYLWDDFMLQRYMAVLVRGNGHAGEQLSNRSQTFDEYATAIERNLLGNKIYLAAADFETVDWFQARFECTINPNVCRSNSRDIQPHLNIPQTIEDAIQCFIDVFIMSMATGGLIHPVSNMATAALYMRPSLRSIFLP